MSPEYLLTALAVTNLVVAAIVLLLARRHPAARRWAPAAAGALLLVAVLDATAAGAHVGYATAIPMVVTDLALIAFIAHLVRKARALEVAAEQARAENAWQRDERERALRDRCAGMF